LRCWSLTCPATSAHKTQQRRVIFLGTPTKAKKNIFYSRVLFLQPGLQMISERDDQYIFFSQQPHVRRIYFGGNKSLRPRITNISPFLFVIVTLSRKSLSGQSLAFVIICRIFGEKRLPFAESEFMESEDGSM